MTALAVERVLFRRDRMMVLVRVPEGPAAHLDAAAAAALLEARPALARHACLNAQGRPFGDILDATSLPHVLEHLIIDFQAELVSAQENGTATRPPLTFVGTTEWLNEREGLARIEVNFTDDLIALDALKRARALMDEGMVRPS